MARREWGGLTLTTDAVIVGAGIIGSSVAYHLSKRGVQCLVFERNAVCAGSSSACGGTVMTQTKPAGPKLELTMHSISLYQRLFKEMDMEYNPGGTILAETPDQVSLLHRLMTEHSQFGNKISWLDPSDVRELQPYASEHVLGATYCANDGEVNPFKANLALADAAERLGTRICRGVEVTGMRVVQGRLDRVDTSIGQISCRWLVVCTGVWSREFGQRIGIEIPVTGRRGDMLVTESVNVRIVRGKVLSGGYLESKHQHRSTLAGGMAIGQSRRGNVVIGSSREDTARMDRKTSPEGLTLVATQAARLFPILRELRVIRAYSGLRPVSPTGFPIIQPSARVEGLWYATGHEGDGIALAPVTGEMVATGVVEGNCTSPFPRIDI